MTKVPDFSAVDFEVVDGNFTAEQEIDYAREAEEALPKFRRGAGLIPGGKSLSGGKKHSPTVQVVLSEDVKARLTEEAEHAGMSVSKYARQLIESHLGAKHAS